jgi:hypothetical protein
MYKATKDFISDRKRYSKLPIVFQPNVKNIGGGEPKHCFENAYDVAQAGKVSGEKIICISGWIVGNFDKSNNCTAIIQHWWNMDDSGRHFDTTPLGEDTVDYVIDLEIYEYGRINFDHIDSNLVPSLMLQDGKYSALLDEDSMSFVELYDLRIELLFALQRLQCVNAAANEPIGTDC